MRNFISSQGGNEKQVRILLSTKRKRICYAETRIQGNIMPCLKDGKHSINYRY